MVKKTFLIQVGNKRALHAWLFQVGEIPQKALIILCHGFTGDKTEWGRFILTAERLNAASFDAITFDFSGSGENTREVITLDKNIEDLDSVYQWALQQGYQQISTIGLSFGGLTALLAHLPNRITCIYWAPAFSLLKRISKFERNMMRIAKKFNMAPIKRFSLNNEPVLIDNSFVESIDKYDVPTILRQWTFPSLIIQGTIDRDIRIQWNKDLFTLMPKTCGHEFIEIANADHNFKADHLDQFIAHSIDWLRKYHQMA